MRTLIEGFPVQISNGAYRKLRAAQQGLFYWDLSSQQIILDELGEFLPQVTEEDGTGVFSKVIAGKEVCARSRAIGESKFPREAISALEHAVTRLQAHINDPHLTPEARLLIGNFKLPDPARLPEFYRQYRNDGKTNILVIWGCDRTNLDSISPLEAVAKLPKEGWFAQLWRVGKLPIGILALIALIALLVGLVMAWPRADLALSKSTALVSEPLLVEIGKSKGDHAVVTWSDAVESTFDESWTKAAQPGAETRKMASVASAHPITLRFGSGGKKAVTLSVGNHYLGVPLPRATARKVVDITEPNRTGGTGSLPGDYSGKHLSVRVSTAPGVFPARLDAVSNRPGEIDFAGQHRQKVEAGQSFPYEGFNKPGVYRCEFLPSNDGDDREAVYVRLDPEAGTPIVANLRLSKTKASAGETIYADPSSSYHTEPDGQIVERQLSLDGGKTFQSVPATGAAIPLSRAGEMKVLLKLKDNQGRAATDEGIVIVEEPRSFTPDNVEVILASGGELSIAEGVLFPSGVATVSQKGQQLLREFAEKIVDRVETIQRIRITGHTDNVPVRPRSGFTDNMELSEARAKAAADILLSQDRVPDHLLEYSGVGDRLPIAPNNSRENQAKNRRIQISVELKRP